MMCCWMAKRNNGRQRKEKFAISLNPPLHRNTNGIITFPFFPLFNRCISIDWAKHVRIFCDENRNPFHMKIITFFPISICSLNAEGFSLCVQNNAGEDEVCVGLKMAIDGPWIITNALIAIAFSPSTDDELPHNCFTSRVFCNATFWPIIAPVSCPS